MRRLQRDGRERPAGVAFLPAEATASAGRFFLGVALTDTARHAIQRHLEAVEIPGRFVLSKDGLHAPLHRRDLARGDGDVPRDGQDGRPGCPD